MIPIDFLILPLGGIFISCSVMWLIRRYLKKQSGPLIKRTEEELKKILDDNSLDQEVSGLIDKRLDDVIQAFKVEIPMIGMFLGKARENSLKEVAMKEFMKLIPSVKTKLKEKVVIGDQAKKMFDDYWRSSRWSAFCAAVIIGVVFGLLEALLLTTIMI
jgi:hypothetical protein